VGNRGAKYEAQAPHTGGSIRRKTKVDRRDMSEGGGEGGVGSAVTAWGEVQAGGDEENEISAATEEESERKRNH